MPQFISSKGMVKAMIRGPLSESSESQLAKQGYYKLWGCTCPKCFVTHIEDNFNDAIVGIDWHKKKCASFGSSTVFNAEPVYVLI